MGRHDGRIHVKMMSTQHNGGRHEVGHTMNSTREMPGVKRPEYQAQARKELERIHEELDELEEGETIKDYQEARNKKLSRDFNNRGERQGYDEGRGITEQNAREQGRRIRKKRGLTEDEYFEELIKEERERLEDEGNETIEQWGDKIEVDKGEGTLRIWTQNVSGLGDRNRGGNSDTRTTLQTWGKMRALGVDIVGFADTKLSDSPSTNQRALYSAGKEEWRARQWGGRQTRFVTSEGHKTRKGANSGGTLIAQAEHLKPFAGKATGDPRGWGRFVAMQLIGANGCKVTVVQGYMPPRPGDNEGGAWHQQMDLIQNLQHKIESKKEERRTLEEKETLEHIQRGSTEGGRRATATPKSLMLRDIARVIRSMGAEYSIVGMDWNTNPPGMGGARSGGESPEEKADREEVELFARELQLEEVISQLQSGREGSSDIPQTWRGNGRRNHQWSWIDYFLVSRKLVQRGAVKAAGALRDTCDSTDHAGCWIDVDLEHMLGKSRLWQDIKEAVQRKRRDTTQAEFKAVKLGDESRVRKYHKAIRELGGISRLRGVGQLVEALREGTFGEAEWKKAEESMQQAEKLLVQAQHEVWAQLPKVGNKRKHWYSEEYVCKARQQRTISNLIKAWKQGARGQRLMRLLENVKAVVPRLPRFTAQRELPTGHDSYEGWERWLGKLRDMELTLKGEVHGYDRRRMRERRDDRQQRLTRQVERDEYTRAQANVLRVTRDGAADTATIREGGRWRAATSGKEVLEHHYKVGKEWMGEDKQRWFYAQEGGGEGVTAGPQSEHRHRFWRLDEAGEAACERLARGELTTEDVESVPPSLRKILPHLQTVYSHTAGRRIEERDYEGSGIGEAISASDWRAFWGQVKGGTRGGKTTLHVDLIKALYCRMTQPDGTKQQDQEMLQIGEAIRQLVNIARQQRKDYASWERELLYFFIKNPGTCGLENCRPVGLLEILFKCSEAFDASAMMSVWAKMGVLEEEQWAFREGRGCEGPLVMWMHMCEEAYLHKMDIGETQVDKKQAFDSPTPAAVRICMNRLGVPTWKVRQYVRRAQRTVTQVISPFGLTEGFVRRQGLTQGSTMSPTLWSAMMAPMTEMVREQAKQAPGRVPDEWGGMDRMVTILFADDEGIPAMGEGAEAATEARMALSITWGTFFGVDLKSTKCWSALGKWDRETNRMLEPEEHEIIIKARDEFRGEQHDLDMKGPYECQRVLGVQRSLGQYPEIPRKLAMEELALTTRAIQGMPRHALLASRIARGVGGRRVVYRLTFQYVFSEEVTKIMRPIQATVGKQCGLSCKTATNLVGATVMETGGDMITTERIVMLMRLLQSEDARGRVTAGAVQRLQQYVGCSTPVLQTKLMRCHCMFPCNQGLRCGTNVGWSGTWVGMIYHDISRMELEITGGLGLPALREGDSNLVDEATADEREMVREGCHSVGIWRWSEVINLAGNGRVRALKENGPLQKATNGKWTQWVRDKLRKQGQRRRLKKGGKEVGAYKVGAYIRRNVWSWRVAAWVETNEVKLGVPIGPTGETQRLRQLEREEWGGESDWNSTTMTRQWFEQHKQSPMLNTPMQGKQWVWRHYKMGGENEQVREIRVGDLRPVEIEVWEVLSTGEPQELIRVVDMHQDLWLDAEGADSGEGQESDSESEGRGIAGQLWDNSRNLTGAGTETWSEQQLQLLLNLGDERIRSMGKLEAWATDLRRAKGVWGWPAIGLFTDGGAEEQGTPAAKGYYGVTIGEMGEDYLPMAEAGGVCHGPAEWTSSYRAELTGALAGLVLLTEVVRWEGDIHLWLDNQGVERGLRQLISAYTPAGQEHAGRNLMRSKQQGYSLQEKWLWEREARDLWEVMILQMDRRGLRNRVKVNWIASHSDRHVPAHLRSYEQQGNIQADRVCTLFRTGARQESPLELPRPRTWRLHLRGREITGDVRKALEMEARSKQLLQYFAQQRGWGEEATRRWAGEAMPNHWLLPGIQLARRATIMKYLYALVWTDDVEARRMQRADTYRKPHWDKALSACSLCGGDSICRGGQAGGWHLYAECKDDRMVSLRKDLQQQINNIIKKEQLKEGAGTLVGIPWMLTPEGTWYELGDVDELKQAIGGVSAVEAEALGKLADLLGMGTARWQEQRRLAAKGLLGKAWEEMLEQQGVSAVTSKRLIKRVFAAATTYGVRAAETFYKARRNKEEDNVMIQGRRAIVTLGERMVKEAVHKVHGDSEEGRRIEELMEGKGWKRKLSWAVRTMSKAEIRKGGKGGYQGRKLRKQRGTEIIRQSLGLTPTNWLEMSATIARARRTRVRLRWDSGHATRQTTLAQQGTLRILTEQKISRGAVTGNLAGNQDEEHATGTARDGRRTGEAGGIVHTQKPTSGETARAEVSEGPTANSESTREECNGTAETHDEGRDEGAGGGTRWWGLPSHETVLPPARNETVGLALAGGETPAANTSNFGRGTKRQYRGAIGRQGEDGLEGGAGMEGAREGQTAGGERGGAESDNPAARRRRGRDDTGGSRGLVLVVPDNQGDPTWQKESGCAPSDTLVPINEQRGVSGRPVGSAGDGREVDRPRMVGWGIGGHATSRSGNKRTERDEHDREGMGSDERRGRRRRAEVCSELVRGVGEQVQGSSEQGRLTYDSSRCRWEQDGSTRPEHNIRPVDAVADALASRGGKKDGDQAGADGSTLGRPPMCDQSKERREQQEDGQGRTNAIWQLQGEGGEGQGPTSASERICQGGHDAPARQTNEHDGDDVHRDEERGILGNREPKELGSRTRDHARVGRTEGCSGLLQVLERGGETAGDAMAEANKHLGRERKGEQGMDSEGISGRAAMQTRVSMRQMGAREDEEGMGAWRDSRIDVDSHAVHQAQQATAEVLLPRGAGEAVGRMGTEVGAGIGKSRREREERRKEQVVGRGKVRKKGEQESEEEGRELKRARWVEGSKKRKRQEEEEVSKSKRRRKEHAPAVPGDTIT